MHTMLAFPCRGAWKCSLPIMLGATAKCYHFNSFRHWEDNKWTAYRQHAGEQHAPCVLCPPLLYRTYNVQSQLGRHCATRVLHLKYLFWLIARHFPRTIAKNSTIEASPLVLNQNIRWRVAVTACGDIATFGYVQPCVNKQLSKKSLHVNKALVSSRIAFDNWTNESDISTKRVNISFSHSQMFCVKSLLKNAIAKFTCSCTPPRPMSYCTANVKGKEQLTARSA